MWVSFTKPLLTCINTLLITLLGLFFFFRNTELFNEQDNAIIWKYLLKCGMTYCFLKSCGGMPSISVALLCINKEGFEYSAALYCIRVCTGLPLIFNIITLFTIMCNIFNMLIIKQLFRL